MKRQQLKKLEVLNGQLLYHRHYDVSLFKLLFYDIRLYQNDAEFGEFVYDAICSIYSLDPDTAYSTYSLSEWYDILLSDPSKWDLFPSYIDQNVHFPSNLHPFWFQMARTHRTASPGATSSRTTFLFDTWDPIKLQLNPQLELVLNLSAFSTTVNVITDDSFGYVIASNPEVFEALPNYWRFIRKYVDVYGLDTIRTFFTLRTQDTAAINYLCNEFKGPLALNIQYTSIGIEMVPVIKLDYVDISKLVCPLQSKSALAITHFSSKVANYAKAAAILATVYNTNLNVYANVNADFVFELQYFKQADYTTKRSKSDILWPILTSHSYRNRNLQDLNPMEVEIDQWMDFVISPVTPTGLMDDSFELAIIVATDVTNPKARFNGLYFVPETGELHVNSYIDNVINKLADDTSYDDLYQVGTLSKGYLRDCYYGDNPSSYNWATMITSLPGGVSSDTYDTFVTRLSKSLLDYI